MKKLSLNKITVAKLSNTQLKEIKGNGGGCDKSEEGGPMCGSGMCMALINAIQ